jgi:hypothetical protein
VTRKTELRPHRHAQPKGVVEQLSSLHLDMAELRKILSSIATMPSLRRRSLRGTPIADSDEALTILRAMPQLEELCLRV